MKEKKILITGASGFLGSYFTSYLKKKCPAFHVKGLLRSEIDFNDLSALAEFLKKEMPDCIFHFAGKVSTSDFSKLLRSNVETTHSLCEAMVKINSKARLILPGSAAEYGNQPASAFPLKETTSPQPINTYGLVKFLQTTLALNFSSRGLDVVVGRVFNILGREVPPAFAVGSFAQQIRKILHEKSNATMFVGNLSSGRDFLDIDDVCSGVLALSEKGKSGKIYNICSGKLYTIKTVLDEMVQASGIKIVVKADPERMRSDDITQIYGSWDEINRDTGWKPEFSLTSSIQKMIQN